MLTLRKEHMDAFRTSMLRNFEGRSAAHLRSNFPEKLAGVGAQDLRQLIRLGMAKCEQYAIFAEVDITRYLEYMTEYGSDFDENPATAWARPILTDPSANGSAKMDRLDDYTTFELRR